MASLEELNTLLLNGPSEIGINAGLDVLVSQDDHLSVGGDLDSIVASIRFEVDTDESVKRVVAVSAALLASAKFACDRDTQYVNDKAPTARAGYKLEGSITKEDVQVAMLIVAVSKVNWWQTNHHTGRSSTEAQGYMAKILKARLPSCTGKANIEAIWRSCHWWDTRHVLASIGLNIREGKVNMNWPKVSDDVRMRLESNPAGTALWADSHVVAQCMKSSPIWTTVPSALKAEFESLAFELEYMRNDPASFHVGATYLTGKPREKLTELSDMLKGFVGAAIAVPLKSSTIERSQALRNLRPDQDFKDIMVGMSTAVREWIKERASSAITYTIGDDIDWSLVNPRHVTDASRNRIRANQEAMRATSA